MYVLNKCFGIKISILIFLGFVLLSNLLTFFIWKDEFDLLSGLVTSCLFFTSVLMVSKIFKNLVNGD